MWNQLWHKEKSYYVIPLFVLVVGMIITGITWYQVFTDDNEKSDFEFQLHAIDAHTAIKQTINNYVSSHQTIDVNKLNFNVLLINVASPSVFNEIYYKIYDVSRASTDMPLSNRLLYMSDNSLNAHRPRHTISDYIQVGNSNWLLVLSSKPGGNADNQNYLSLIVLLTGSFITIGISLVLLLRVQSIKETNGHIFYDYLTNLPNRRLLENRFTQALANARRTKTQVALFFLDLDHFKPINDLLGHDAGDKVLKTVASRLAACLRTEDTLARVGGDEFVILLTNVTKKEDIITVARKIISEVSAPMVMYSKELHVGSSIGIAIFPTDGTDYATLTKNADNAMYAAKHAGRNNFKFVSDSSDEIEVRNNN